MSGKHPITVAYGDGIGPEIMEAALFILQEAGASLEIEKVEIGEKVFNQGVLTGIEEKTWDSLRRTKVFFKSPITTPQGGGFKSLNVTVRTSLGLYANIRPCASYFPYIQTKHPSMDLVIIRENEEDLYTGIEYRQTPDICHAIKMISRPGSEKIIRYAFEYAACYGHKKVSCFTKDNILKMSDGLFHKIFNEIGNEYPQIEKDHWIIDIGSAKLAETPENFDVIVLPNLYGDILSDVAAQISGSVGLAGTANIGEKGAMFEAIHGSAPSIAGKDCANPSGLILASVYMLLHIEQPQIATLIHNAWLKTIEEGVHTSDIFKKGSSKKRVGTKEFAKEVVTRLGLQPQHLKPVFYGKENRKINLSYKINTTHQERNLVGVDVYLYSKEEAEKIANKILQFSPAIELSIISNRGVKVWPKGIPETFCIDQYRCRFLNSSNEKITTEKVFSLLKELNNNGFDIVKTENLYTFNGELGFSK